MNTGILCISILCNSILCTSILLQLVRAASEERVKQVNMKLKKTLMTFLDKFEEYRCGSMSLAKWNQVVVEHNLTVVYERGNGVVYRDNSGAYAVKLSTIKSDSPAFTRKRINHPNIMKVYCWAIKRMIGRRKKKKKFILVASVYELCDVIIDSRLINNDENRIRSIVQQVLLGLEYLHSKKLVHLDIKPDNIMGETGENGSITYKLIDLDTIVDLVPENVKNRRQVFTRGYVDPEYRKNRVMIESDIYQLGMTAWALSYMEKGDKEWCKKWRKKYNKRETQHEFKPLSSVEYCDFVRICTDYDPRKRPNCRELLHHPFITGRSSS
ncbi:hypothetical protein ECANGB1_2688 [Enterospora canceri]|uniref:Protein kinase domain-containing protein n=1 Tax=Enterospora canceri TaxID=1081671 RepID=A0A1Y1S9F4_9MICR|nr:hypothetical protein ECANGB1_2688 [Enterospora canceri]